MIITATALAAEALFLSDLQPSEQPTPEQVCAAVNAMVERHGSSGCAACVAAEFGDHPETATRRMTWVRETLAHLAPATLPRPRAH